MKKLRILGLPVTAALVLVLGCSESPTSPQIPENPEPSASLFGDLWGVVSDLGDGLSDTTDDLTDDLSDAVGEINPTLGEVTGGVGDVVDGTVASVVNLVTVTTVERDRPVRGPEWCDVETIGWRGGTMECEEAGLRVVFPRGALTEQTRISIRIPDRDLVGYEFYPHGLEFERDVRIYQSLDGTDVEGDWQLLGDLVGAYVEDVTPEAEAIEVLPVTLSGGWWWRAPDTVRIDIRHFSGYICAIN